MATYLVQTCSVWQGSKYGTVLTTDDKAIAETVSASLRNSVYSRVISASAYKREVGKAQAERDMERYQLESNETMRGSDAWRAERLEIVARAKRDGVLLSVVDDALIVETDGTLDDEDLGIAVNAFAALELSEAREVTYREECKRGRAPIPPMFDGRGTINVEQWTGGHD